eukprot:4304713-Amphidinium_carterae.1
MERSSLELVSSEPQMVSNKPLLTDNCPTNGNTQGCLLRVKQCGLACHQRNYHLYILECLVLIEKDQ